VVTATLRYRDNRTAYLIPINNIYVILSSFSDRLELWNHNSGLEFRCVCRRQFVFAGADFPGIGGGVFMATMVPDGGRNAPKARSRVPCHPIPQESRHRAQNRLKTNIFQKWCPARKMQNARRTPLSENVV